MALVDGDNGMGHLVMSRAVELAIEKARTAGVAWVGARAAATMPGRRRCMRACRCAHDMIGLYFAVGNANHLPPWGGARDAAVDQPDRGRHPGRRGAAGGARHGDHGGRLRQGQGQGQARRDDARGLDDRPRRASRCPTRKRADEGFLLPIGGYKGYGLALIVGLLAGTLNGAAMGRDVIDFNNDDVTTTNTGQAILVIDLGAFGDPARVQGSASTRWCATCATASACPASIASGCPASRATQARAPSPRRHPALARLVADLTVLAGELGIEPLLH